MKCIIPLWCLVAAVSALAIGKFPLKIKSMQLKLYPADPQLQPSKGNLLPTTLGRYTFTNMSGPQPILKGFNVKFTPDNPSPGTMFSALITGKLLETLKDQVIVQLQLQIDNNDPVETSFDLCQVDDPDGKFETICPIPAGIIEATMEMVQDEATPVYPEITLEKSQDNCECGISAARGCQISDPLFMRRQLRSMDLIFTNNKFHIKVFCCKVL